MNIDQYYTKELLKDYIANFGFEIGDFTYGFPIIRWWGENVKLKIGKFCSIAANVKIFLGGKHRTEWITTYPFTSPEVRHIWPNLKKENLPELPLTDGDVIIGNDVWLCDDTTIMSGVTIGDGAVIATKAIVTKNVQPYTIMAGNPALPIRKRFSDEEIAMLLELKWWNWSTEKINENIVFLCSSDIKGLYKQNKSKERIDF